MKDDTLVWLNYASENLASARILLKNNLFNPCLQNAQQCVEKILKAYLIENSISVKKTHDILEILQILKNNNLEVNLTEDECDLLDSIYLPSKYPLGSVLPDFNPDEVICIVVLNIAERVFDDVSLAMNH